MTCVLCHKPATARRPLFAGWAEVQPHFDHEGRGPFTKSATYTEPPVCFDCRGLPVDEFEAKIGAPSR